MKTVFISMLMLVFCSCSSMNGKQLVVHMFELNPEPSPFGQIYDENHVDGFDNRGMPAIRMELKKHPELSELELADVE